MSGWDNAILYLVLMAGCSIAVMASILAIIICCVRKRKLRTSILSLIASVLLLTGNSLFIHSHATYYKYNDWWVEQHSREEIRERYGDFDIEKPAFAAYFIYCDMDGFLPDHLQHYYYIWFDKNGMVNKVEDGCQIGG